jgi:hypothetical protein
MADFIIKQGDLEPELAVTLIGADGAPADITTATSVRLRFATTAGVELWVRDVGIVDAPTGRVAYLWQARDTEQPGAFYAEIVVDWVGRPQTYPPSGYLLIIVEPRL